MSFLMSLLATILPVSICLFIPPLVHHLAIHSYFLPSGICPALFLLLLLPLERSGSFPYFRTVRGVLPANAVTQIHHSRRPCPDPLLPTLPPFQPSRLASCFYWIHQATPPRARSHGCEFQPPLKRLAQCGTRTRDPEGHERTRYL